MRRNRSRLLRESEDNDEEKVFFFSWTLVGLGGLVTLSALNVVDQTEQAIVFQFGEPKRVVREPGRHDPGFIAAKRVSSLFQGP